MVDFPHRCEICFHQEVNLANRKEFEEHASSNHFPFVLEALKKIKHPVQCSFEHEPKTFMDYKAMFAHMMKSHQILSQFHNEIKNAVLQSETDPKNYTQETVSDMIQKAKLEERFCSSIKRVDYYECQIQTCPRIFKAEPYRFIHIDKLRSHLAGHITSETLKSNGYISKDKQPLESIRCNFCESSFWSIKSHLVTHHFSEIDELIKKQGMDDSLKLIEVSNLGELNINESNMVSNPPNDELLESQNNEENMLQTDRISKEPSPHKKIKLDNCKTILMISNVRSQGDNAIVPNDSLLKSIENIGNEVQKLAQENLELKTKNEVLEHDLKKHKQTEQRIDALQKENDTLKQDLAKSESELKEKNEANENEFNHYKQTDQRINDLMKELEDLKKMKAITDKEKSNLKLKNSLLTIKNKAMKDKLKVFESNLYQEKSVE